MSNMPKQYLLTENMSQFNVMLEKALAIKTFDYPNTNGKLNRNPINAERILHFGTARHPTTGNMLTYGIDLNTLTPDDLAILMKPEYLAYAWQVSNPIKRRDRLINIINKNERKLKAKTGIGEEGFGDIGHRLVFKRGPAEYHEKRKILTPTGEKLEDDPHYNRTSSWKSFYANDVKNREMILLDLNSFHNTLKQLNKLGPDYTFNNLSDDYLRKASESGKSEPIDPDDIIYDKSEEEENVKPELVDEEPIDMDEVEETEATEVELEPDIDVKIEPETDIETGKIETKFEPEIKAQEPKTKMPQPKIDYETKKTKGFKPKLNLSIEPLEKSIDKRLKEIEQLPEEPLKKKEPEGELPKEPEKELEELEEELPKEPNLKQEINDETPDIIAGSQMTLNKILNPIENIDTAVKKL